MKKVIAAVSTASFLALLPMAAAAGAEREEGVTMHHATGAFDVQVSPKSLDGPVEDASLGRFALDKVYHGGLDGTGRGQMLTAGSPKEGSAGYVAIERFEGKLDGREGSFALMHRGSMSPAGQTLEVTVVPGSGAGALSGISGTLAIRIEGKQHFYDLDYELPKAP